MKNTSGRSLTTAIRSFLIYNRQARVFIYVLDETVNVADSLAPVPHMEHIQIGKRTGFAFYNHQSSNRKILIGVFEDNARSNNHLDGPFDQLPDNFVQGDTLRQAILEVDPRLIGKIDRFGKLHDGSGRYLITPYRRYRSEKELLVFDRCETNGHRVTGRYSVCSIMALTARVNKKSQRHSPSAR